MGLSDAERQRRYIARLKERAAQAEPGKAEPAKAGADALQHKTRGQANRGRERDSDPPTADPIGFIERRMKRGGGVPSTGRAVPRKSPATKGGAGH
jgi:hypothetical protein